MVFPLPKTLVKTLAKNLTKNLVKNLANNLGGGSLSNRRCGLLAEVFVLLLLPLVSLVACWLCEADVFPQ